MPEKPRRIVFRRSLCLIGLLLLACLSLSPVRAFAAADISHAYVGDVAFTGETEGGPFFLYDSASLDSHRGTVWVLWGTLDIHGTLEGDVYSLFSQVRVEGRVTGRVLSLSSQVTGEADAAPLFPALAYVPGLVRGGSGFYDDRIPAAVWAAMAALGKLLLLTAIYPVRPGFYGQCAAVLARRPVALLRNGLAVYGLGILTAVLFALTPLGAFFSAEVALVMLIGSLLGEIGLALALGHGLDRLFRRKSSPYANLWIGVIILEALKQLPLVGIWLRAAAAPVACLGLLATALWEGYARRRFYPTPYDGAREAAFDRERLRRKILGNAD